MNCPVCQEEAANLSGGRCDQCWDDVAKGRDPKKRSRKVSLGDVAIDLDAQFGDQADPTGRAIAKMIAGLAAFGDAGRLAAEQFARVITKYGPTPDVLTEIQAQLDKREQERLKNAAITSAAIALNVQPPAHPVDPYLESQYIAGNPAWKKADPPRWDRSHPKNRSTPLGVMQEQIEMEVGKSGKPIPGKAYRDAYLQLHTCPPDWPEYDEQKPMSATSGEITSIVGVDQTGLLGVKLQGGAVTSIPPSSIEQGVDWSSGDPGPLEAVYDLGNGVTHREHWTPEQNAGFVNWKRQNENVPRPIQVYNTAPYEATYEAIGMNSDGTLRVRWKGSETILGDNLTGQLVNETASDLVFDFDMGGGVFYRGAVSKLVYTGPGSPKRAGNLETDAERMKPQLIQATPKKTKEQDKQEFVDAGVVDSALAKP